MIAMTWRYLGHTLNNNSTIEHSFLKRSNLKVKENADQAEISCHKPAKVSIEIMQILKGNQNTEIVNSRQLKPVYRYMN